MTENQPVDDFIIIGIDFGTTYSGIAWAYSREPEDIEIVMSWETELNHCSNVEKAPTQLLCNGESDTSWGFSVPADKDALKWFKLLLLDEADISPEMSNSSQLQRTKQLLRDMNKDPVDVIGCYLRKIWNHAIESIRHSVGAELLQKSRFHVVITLPAIWPPYAQQRMRKAAKASGIADARPCGDTTLCFISEPEAAALATIKDLSKRSTVKVGDTMVICDAGGGTVDLISYVVESIKPFVVKECVRGDGGLCGAVFLDENFLQLIKRRIGSDSWGNVSIAEQTKFLNDGWEHGIKPQFSNQDRTWLVDLPDSCSVSASGRRLKRRRTLELSSNDMLSVYTPIVDEIDALVRLQTQAIQLKYGRKANYILLVGGFGRSAYLYKKLESSFESTVLQSGGSKPWTAICRGAVVSGITSHNLSPSLEMQIGARVARKSYGICFTTKFDRTRHLWHQRFWSSDYQQWRAMNQMKWFLKEGDNMLTQQPVREQYERLYSERIDSIHHTIYSCSVFPPPLFRETSVEKLCEVQWTRDIDIESLPTWTNPLGKVFHKLEYEIEMTCEGGIVDFTIYFEGKRVGARNVEVQFL